MGVFWLQVRTEVMFSPFMSSCFSTFVSRTQTLLVPPRLSPSFLFFLLFFFLPLKQIPSCECTVSEVRNICPLAVKLFIAGVRVRACRRPVGHKSRRAVSLRRRRRWSLSDLLVVNATCVMEASRRRRRGSLWGPAEGGRACRAPTILRCKPHSHPDGMRDLLPQVEARQMRGRDDNRSFPFGCSFGQNGDKQEGGEGEWWSMKLDRCRWRTRLRPSRLSGPRGS